MKICITKEYSNKRVFDDFSLEIPENKILCVLGESGAGKTTLLNILAGLTDYEGSIIPPQDNCAYVFQSARLLPHLTARENLRYTAQNEIAEKDIDNVLEKLELKEFENRKARNLSGGEKQRVAMARAFLSPANLLLMDEPFSSLDIALKLRLVSAFAKTWQENRKTTIFVTHDIEEGLMLADTIVVLKNGKVESVFNVERNEFPAKYGKENGLRAKILQALCNCDKGE